MFEIYEILYHFTNLYKNFVSKFTIFQIVIVNTSFHKIMLESSHF